MTSPRSGAMLPAVMNALFDTHVHFDMIEDPGGPASIIARARAAGVGAMVAVGGDARGNREAAALAAANPGVVFATAGFNRDCAAPGVPVQDMCAGLADDIARSTPVAIGEIGLDYHYHPETRREQVALFEAQLDLARRAGLPVIVHCREAEDDMAGLLKDHFVRRAGAADRAGVLHCFTGDGHFAEAVLEAGMYVSFSGIVSFANAGPLRRVAESVPEDRLLVETDSPFLAPMPLRGRKNEPAFIPHVAAVLARTRNRPPDEIAAVTWRNACRLFGVAPAGGLS